MEDIQDLGTLVDKLIGIRFTQSRIVKLLANPVQVMQPSRPDDGPAVSQYRQLEEQATELKRKISVGEFTPFTKK